MHIFRTEQWLPYPVELLFGFFADPANLPRLMPRWQRAKIEASSIVPPAPLRSYPDLALRSSTVVAGSGTRLTLSFRPFPFSPIHLRWEAEITDFQWNHHFADTQLRGPFAHWHHLHIIAAESRADTSGALIPGSLVRDEIEYQLPFGKLGSLAHPVIAVQLHRTFDYRHRRTLELLAQS